MGKQTQYTRTQTI